MRAIEGLKRLLQRNHFDIPEELERELNNFIRENDTVELFLEDSSIARCEDGKIYIKELYPKYKTYCLESGLRPLGKRTFDRRLVDKHFKKEHDF